MENEKIEEKEIEESDLGIIGNASEKNHIKRKKRYRKYTKQKFIFKFGAFWVYFIYDIYRLIRYGREFEEFGLDIYAGRQGGGKTMAMVEYLERMRHRYPNALIATNFGYKYEDFPILSLNDILETGNGTDGIIYALDEIQNEWSTANSKNFPVEFLSDITQQRKQRKKIVATSQVFTRVAKPLREQTFNVIECRTLARRWTFIRGFDAEEYNKWAESGSNKDKLRRIFRRNFLQNDYLRNCFDSYARIERLKEAEKLAPSERLTSSMNINIRGD